jgi:hypothetical protein
MEPSIVRNPPAGTLRSPIGSTSKLARFVALVIAALLAAALSSSVVVMVTFSMWAETAEEDPLANLAKGLVFAAVVLVVAIIAALVGTGFVMRALDIRPVVPLLGVTVLLVPLLTVSLGSVLSQLALGSVPLAAGCAYALVAPPGRSAVWRAAAGGLVVLVVGLGALA